MSNQNNTQVDASATATALRFTGAFVAGASRGNSVYLHMIATIIGMLETGAIKMTSALFNVLTSEAFREDKRVQAYLDGFEEGQEITRIVVGLSDSPYNVSELVDSIKSATTQQQSNI